MARRWFPSLRAGTEGKALTITGYGSAYGSGYGAMPRISSGYGIRDSAAGWDLDTVVQDGYERVVWVFKAVEIIAGNASRLPFIIKDGEDELENHPLMRVMNKKANPLETGRAFRKRLSAQVLLSKRGAFVEVTRNRGGQITRLDLLPPDRVRIIPDLAGEYVAYFEFTRPDGVVRNLAPEQVRWIREPHPLDPFSGVTPLEAAGMSVELDRLARAYNVQFINRDGRPGGVIGVDTDGLDEAELIRIGNLFKPGVQHAGNITAIGTGKGGMNYIDTSARPRDMAYETTSDKAKKEILAAFGVPESIAGNSSERTFDNASQEELNFWNDPMLPHLDLIAAAFDGDVDDAYDCGFDTSGVEALELPNRRRRTEAREEFDKGLRSVDEYRDIAKLDPIDSPQSRALWISPAKAPIPARPQDAAALGLEDPNAAGGAGGPGGALPPGPDGAPPALTARETVDQAIAEGAQVAEGDLPVAPEGDAAAAVAAALAERGDEVDDADGQAAAAVEQARLETKGLNFGPLGELNTFDPGDAEARRVELAVTAALEATFNRQAAVIAARLESPKTRRGTPYWVPESDDDPRAGDERIDAARVVDTPRWVAETQETLRPLVTSASRESATGLLTAMAASGALIAPLGAVAPVVGRTVEAPAETAETIAMTAAQASVPAALLALATAQHAVESWLTERVADIDRILTEQSNPHLPTLIESVRKVWDDKAREFAQSLAVTVAQTAVWGGADGAVSAVVPQLQAKATSEGSYEVELPPEVLRTWVTRHDEHVRAAHAAADGQTVGVGEPFIVGGHELRFPSDPLAPPAVSRWCRCWVKYAWSSGAKFTVVRNDSQAA